jgi:hypothetical protein
VKDNSTFYVAYGGCNCCPNWLLVRPPTAYQQLIHHPTVLAVWVERLPKPQRSKPSSTEKGQLIGLQMHATMKQRVSVAEYSDTVSKPFAYFSIFVLSTAVEKDLSLYA